MKRYYANLLGEWVDITDAGTVADHQKPSIYFEEQITELCKYDHINVQYSNKNYHIHPSLIQIVTE